MQAELFAISAAVLFALGNVIMRIALNKGPSPFNSFLVFGSATVLLWSIVLLKGYALPSMAALVLFGLKGIIDPGIAASLILVAFRRLGVAITVPIISASPLVSTTLSVLFLGEKPTLFIVLGTIIIMAGVTLLVFKPGRVKIDMKCVLIAVAGTALLGLAAVITKLALNASDKPISGLAVSFTVGIFFQVLVISALGKSGELAKTWEKARMFLLAGVFIAVAFIAYNLAFSTGLVSIVFPLIGAQPLFVLLLSMLLLRKYEKVTRNIVLGTVMIVAGAALLTVF
ncbi:DMT family transporter [Candidatus Woesearchaeota archaeon]|nr:DMT family transporter [Candidatus Woesearchaeota archaeon]